MPNALPILLLGGAALLMMGGKKKTKTKAASFGKIEIPPDAPPPLSKTVKKSGSGYPGVTRGRMQEIQTMLMALGYDVGSYGTDGKYGPNTKAAVLAFQKDYMPKSDGWDGKPGPKTQAALEKAEAGRTQEQLVAAQNSPQQASQLVDECDPLDPGTWGSGNLCVLDGSRWVRKKAQVTAPKPTAPKPKKTTASNDFADCLAAMQSTWKATGGYDLRMGDDPVHVEDKESQFRHLLHKMTSNWCKATKDLSSWEIYQIMYDFAANKGDVPLAKYIQNEMGQGQQQAPSGPPKSDLTSTSGIETIVKQGAVTRNWDTSLYWQIRRYNLSWPNQIAKGDFRGGNLEGFWFDPWRRNWRSFSMGPEYFWKDNEINTLENNLREMLTRSKEDLSGGNAWPPGEMP